MIIVKTKNGDRFINDRAVTMVEHDREEAVANAYGDKGVFFRIEDVEGVVYTNDAQPTSWKDEGSEIQRLKADLEKEQKKFSHLLEHFGYIRELYRAYESAVISIKEQAKQAERENKDIYVSPLAIIEAAEKKCEEANEEFEKARKKWEE